MQRREDEENEKRARRATTPPATAPPIIAAEGVELLLDEVLSADEEEALEGVVISGEGAVVIIEVRRTTDVRPFVEAVEERIMVVFLDVGAVVVVGRLGT